jgi:uncharacterized protein YecT (DUF1311 family)
MMKYILAIILIASFSSTAVARQEFKSCIRRNKSTAGINGCYVQSIKKWNMKLNAVYYDIMKADGPNSSSYLKKSEISWILYRRYNCIAAGDIMFGSSSNIIEKDSCLRTMLIDRVKDLEPFLPANRQH